MRRVIVALCSMVALTGCDSPADADQVQVFRSLGTLQCVPDAGALDRLRHDLTAAGVTVLDARLDDDGMMRIALCGSPDGRIAVFTIPAAQLKTAQAAGFQPHHDVR
ncbi:hypothetical protein [Paracoccus sp. (in: a-proteobacteria)]|uniref:hypothetical protein n=1 Tax=Paracoccus sp. TaxID=267 RepID=UPI0026DF0A9E|nr:hypothetical protein [Paracoccus sp. (in: a-proteobacteria)]MDO5647077.1 hypothetical protein [Paracoccus sp. (in: a-proteobacteria)]